MVPERFRSDVSATLLKVAGSDEFICQAARVSTLGTTSVNTSEASGLIKYLMRARHGSPFEHGFMSMLIECPIFVGREFMRHRIGHSFNEESGRYKMLNGVFYMPPPERPIVQVGKPANYELVPGTPEQYELLCDSFVEAYSVCWERYQRMLDAGIAKEVARDVLPVGTFTSFYVSVNPRSAMSFLSLRTHEPEATYPSKPLWEIEAVARQIETAFAANWPLTYAAFNEYGRVSP